MKERLKLIYRLFVLLVLISCNPSKKDNMEQDSKQILDSDYNGVWAENMTDNSWFTIKGDTIVNFDHDDRMYFSISGDTMLIDYGDFVGRHLILKKSKDSLILKNEDGSINKLYKR